MGAGKVAPRSTTLRRRLDARRRHAIAAAGIAARLFLPVESS
jgi:hypothetical protein